jgi:hypothetical protein
MDSTTSTILGLVILLAIGGFVCFAMFPSRRTPPGDGTNDYSSAGGPGPDYPGSDSGSHGGGH